MVKKLFLLICFCGVQPIAFCQDIIPVNVQQYDDRIEVKISYDPATKRNRPNLSGVSDDIKYTSQSVYITVRNKTQNRLVAKIVVIGEKICGITEKFLVSDVNGYGILPPGETKSASFDVSLGSLGDRACNPTKKADGTYNYIRTANYELTQIIENKPTPTKSPQINENSSGSSESKSTSIATKNPDSKQSNATNNTTTLTTNSQKAADDDFWSEKKKSSVNNNTNNQPEIAMSTDGKYYRKDANNKYQEINQDDYYRIKKQQQEDKATTSVAQQQAKKEFDQKAVDELMVGIKKDQDANNKIYTDIDRSFAQQQQGFAAVKAREDARQNVKDISTLSGNYSSVDQLMADFNQKMGQLNSAVSDLTAKKNQALYGSADATFGSSAETAMYGEGIKAIGAIFNGAKEAKERKKAQEELKAQKEYMINNMLAQEKQLLTNIRVDLFGKFKEGALPLSSSTLKADVIYYFAYAYNPAQLGLKQAQLYISNVFPISRYSDGTWPFKTSITNDIARLTSLDEVLHGYYTSQQEAQAMQVAMGEVFRKTGGEILPIVFKGKKITSSAGTSVGDFWETGKKHSDSLATKPVKKDDFWKN